MGLLIDGVWHDKWYDTKSSGGKFVRQDAGFRNWVTVDGSSGPSGKGGFMAEPGRYHLYVSLACPWAHRTLIVRSLKKLENIISVDVVHYHMADHGWIFEKDENATGDSLYGNQYMHQIYQKASKTYTGRVTVPVLWDKHTETIVSNESSEIIRMLNSAFDEWADKSVDLYPSHLRADIDTLNDRIYDSLNNGVYRCGFATTQDAYNEAFGNLFETLDWLDQHLANNRYLTGDQITEADWRLFTTLIRFDAVYVGHFKCNKKRIEDYSNISGYVRELFQVPGVAGTVNMHHIKHHYYGSHDTINPTRIVPQGPELNFNKPHERDSL